MLSQKPSVELSTKKNSSSNNEDSSHEQHEVIDCIQTRQSGISKIIGSMILM